jgi:hypothetical protein
LSGFKAGGGAFGCIPENVLPERAKICGGGDFGNISRYAQTMPTIGKKGIRATNGFVELTNIST